MSTVKILWKRGRKNAVLWVILAVFLLAGIAGVLGKANRAVAAGGGGRKCLGTFLMVEGSGVQSLWTFTGYGSLQITSSAQDVDDAFTDGFSHQHGAWKRTVDGIRTTTLDFATDGAYAPTSIARVDALLNFANDCNTVTGGFDLRIYPAPDDPLDINGAAIVLSDTLTGRKVTTD